MLRKTHTSIPKRRVYKRHLLGTRGRFLWSHPEVYSASAVAGDESPPRPLIASFDVTDDTPKLGPFILAAIIVYLGRMTARTALSCKVGNDGGTVGTVHIY